MTTEYHATPAALGASRTRRAIAAVEPVAERAAALSAEAARIGNRVSGWLLWVGAGAIVIGLGLGGCAVFVADALLAKIALGVIALPAAIVGTIGVLIGAKIREVIETGTTAGKIAGWLYRNARERLQS